MMTRDPSTGLLLIYPPRTADLIIGMSAVRGSEELIMLTLWLDNSGALVLSRGSIDDFMWFTTSLIKPEIIELGEER